jgi:hypothetical protein
VCPPPTESASASGLAHLFSRGKKTRPRVEAPRGFEPEGYSRNVGIGRILFSQEFQGVR